MTQQHSSVVIDVGSGFCKAGLSGEDAPRTQFPSIVGKPKMPSIMVGMDQKQAYVGDEAQLKRGVLNIKNPLKNGIITNWEDMTKILHHTYYGQLRVTPQQHPCLITQPPKNPKANRQKLTEIMFEIFNVPSLYLAITSVLSLYSSGRTTGLVLDSGDGVTHTVPIYQGYALPHAIQQCNYGGWNLTQRFHKLLDEVGMKFSFSAEYQILRDIKQKHCYVALDFDQQTKLYQQTNKNDCKYMLPDGQTITLGEQRFKCPQILFNPSKFEEKMPALHQLIYQSIMKCDNDVRKDMYYNIVMSGGSTMFPGVPERINKELANLVMPEIKLNVVGPPQRQFLAWIGGSILSSLSTFQAMWISKAQYQESGSSIVNRKCF